MTTEDRELMAGLACLNKQLVRYMSAELDADSGLTEYRWPVGDQQALGDRMIELGGLVKERATAAVSAVPADRAADGLDELPAGGGRHAL